MKSLCLPVVVFTGFVLALGCGGAGQPEMVMPSSLAEAEELCSGADAAGCLYLAEMFENDLQARKENPEAFLTYATQSCEAGLAPMCYELGFIRITGRGGKVDKAAAGEHLAKGCDLGEGRACFTAGVQARRGDGVGRNPKRALGFLERACELSKDFKSCAEVGQMWTEDKLRGAPNMETSKKYYDLGCKNEPSHPFCGKK